jgi:hypothetical protein
MVAINKIVTETYTNSSGYNLYVAIKDNFVANQPIELSFDGISSTSSSFLNSSFGALIEEFGLDKFTSLVKIKNVTKGEAEIIKKYIQGFKNTHKNF